MLNWIDGILFIATQQFPVVLVLIICLSAASQIIRL